MRAAFEAHFELTPQQRERYSTGDYRDSGIECRWLVWQEAIAAPVAAQEPKLSIVLALARCGLAHEPPSNAYVHQLRRLTESLAPDDARYFKALLEWHDSAREKSSVRVVLASQPAPGERQPDAWTTVVDGTILQTYDPDCAEVWRKMGATVEPMFRR